MATVKSWKIEKSENAKIAWLEARVRALQRRENEQKATIDQQAKTIDQLQTNVDGATQMMQTILNEMYATAAIPDDMNPPDYTLEELDAWLKHVFARSRRLESTDDAAVAQGNSASSLGWEVVMPLAYSVRSYKMSRIQVLKALNHLRISLEANLPPDHVALAPMYSLQNKLVKASDYENAATTRLANVADTGKADA